MLIFLLSWYMIYFFALSLSPVSLILVHMELGGIQSTCCLKLKRKIFGRLHRYSLYNILNCSWHRNFDLIHLFVKRDSYYWKQVFLMLNKTHSCGPLSFTLRYLMARINIGSPFWLVLWIPLQCIYSPSFILLFPP